MKTYSSLLIFMSLIFKLSEQQLCEPSDPVQEKRINPGEGFSYNNSRLDNIQWRFTTDPKYNLTFVLHELDADMDCAKGGPLLRVKSYPDQADYSEITACSNRMVQFEYPKISSNKIDVKYCTNGPRSRVSFSVSTTLAGFAYVSEKKKHYQVFRHDNDIQWIMLISQDDLRDYDIQVDITQLRLRNKRPGNKCKNKFLKVINPKNLSVVENICHYENKDENFPISIPGSIANITFKKASFQMTTQLVPKLLKKSPDSVLANITSDPLPTTVPDGTNDISNNHMSKNLLYVGIAVGCVLIVAIVIALFCWKKKCCPNSTPKTPSNILETSKHNKSKPDQNPSLNGTQSLSNAMYGRVVGIKAEQNLSSTNTPNGTIISNVSSSSRENEMNQKRKIRLSQLADKYINVELSNQTNSPLFRQRLDHSDSFHSSQKKNQAALDSRATFNHTRPPQPLPEQLVRSNNYESVDTRLSNMDLVPPAYCSLPEEKEDLLSPQFDRFSSQGSLPVGQYGFSQNSNLLQNRDVATYISSDTLDTSDALEESDDDHSSTYLSHPQIGKDGYLSLLSTVNEENRKSTQNLYVSPNAITTENFEKHFNIHSPTHTEQAESRSAANVAARKRSLAGSAQAVRRGKFSSSKLKGTREFESEASDRHQYKAPRPSAPEIFVQSAYTSGDDVENIRQRLEKLASGNQKLRNVQSENKISSLDVDSNLYDSPASSSKNSLVDLPNSFYDTPRPSLPHIYPPINDN